MAKIHIYDGEGLKFLFLLFEFTMKGLSLQTEKNEGFCRKQVGPFV
jgi:hypothetical protein